MTQLHDQLHDLLDDYTDEPSRSVLADPGGALAAGRGRRRRRRALTGGLVVLVLVLGAALGLDAGRDELAPAGPPGAPAESYPARISKPLLGIRDLPDRPGALAAVVERVEEHVTYDESLGWYAVSPSGRLWSLPPDRNDDIGPALSADGTHLGHADEHDHYVTRDLTTGVTTAYPDIAPTLGEPGEGTYQLAPQTPAFWSPDNARLLLHSTSASSDGPGAIVLADGRVTPVVPAGARGVVHAIGWADAGHIAWLTARRGVIGLIVTDLDGRLVRTTSLGELPADEFVSQWTGSISPDGSLVALSQLGPAGDRGRLHDAATGTQVGSFAMGRDVASACGLVWRGIRPVVPTITASGTTTLADVDQRPLVLVDPRLATRCSVWSSTALDGAEHRDLTTRMFGSSTKTLSWRWREYTAWGGGVAVLLLGALVAARRRYRVRGRPGD